MPTAASVGLPPPPEFLPRASSAELPLEGFAGGGDDLTAVTLMGIPPLRLGEREPSDVHDLAEELVASVGVERPSELGGLDRGGAAGAEPSNDLGAARPDESLYAISSLDLGIGADETMRAPVDGEQADESLHAMALLERGAARHDETVRAILAREPDVARPDETVRAEVAAPPTAADESDDVDIDVSEDTVPVVPLTALREPYPELPVAPSQVPTSPVTAVRTARPVTNAPVVRLAPVSRPAPVAASGAVEPRSRSGRYVEPEPPKPRLGLWIGVGAAVGAVISIAAILWVSTRTDKDASPDQGSSGAVEAKAGDAPGDEGKTGTAPADDDAKGGPTLPGADAHAGIAPGPAGAEPLPADDGEASVITVERDGSAYRAAVADYQATGSQRALLAMTTAACELEDGPRARAAFRKLLGRKLRTKAIVACRAARVDVMSTAPGYTGAELLDQAREALEAGDAQTALDKAHQSNKVERSSDAVLVKALAACSLGDAGHAQRLLPHVSIKARPKLVEGCKKAGVTLRD